MGTEARGSGWWLVVGGWLWLQEPAGPSRRGSALATCMCSLAATAVGRWLLGWRVWHAGIWTWLSEEAQEQGCCRYSVQVPLWLCFIAVS